MSESAIMKTIANTPKLVEKTFCDAIPGLQEMADQSGTPVLEYVCNAAIDSVKNKKEYKRK